MSELSARKAGNPFDADVRDTQRLKGLSSLEEREAVSADIHTLGRDGYLILEGLLSADTVAEIGAEMDTIHATTPLGITDFEGFRTKRIYNCMKKMRSADDVCAHSRILAIIEGYLHSQIQLSSATTPCRVRAPRSWSAACGQSTPTPQPTAAPSYCPAVTPLRRNRSR